MSYSLVASLARHEFFEGMSRKDAELLRQDIQERGWPAIFEESHRLHFADAEDLAEGGIGEFLLRLRPYLAARGVNLPDIEDEINQDGYVVRIGDTPHRIYDADALKRHASGSQPELLSGQSMIRAFEIVNELLESAGSPERLYAVHSGRDLQAFLLTPELFHVITAHPEASLEDGPYVPEEEYPWFGRPH